jgi:DNA-binding transcriptional ArsR family regulator
MESVDLDAVAEGLAGLGHPTRIRLLVLFESGGSPTELAEVTGLSLPAVAYHVRILSRYGLVEMTHTEPRRGALQHFYRRTELADLLLGRIAILLDLPKKGRGGVTKRREDLSAWARG